MHIFAIIHEQSSNRSIRQNAHGQQVTIKRTTLFLCRNIFKLSQFNVRTQRKFLTSYSSVMSIRQYEFARFSTYYT